MNNKKEKIVAARYVRVLYQRTIVLFVLLFPLGSYAQTANLDALKSRASQGDTRAMYELARDYDEGINGAPKDPKAAFYWINQGVKMGAPWAFYGAGAAYEQGVGTEKDLSLAKYWYEQALASGIRQALPALNALKARVGSEPKYAPTSADRPAAVTERDGKIYLSLDSAERIEPPPGAPLGYPRCKLTFSIQNNSSKRLAELLLVGQDAHGSGVRRVDCKIGDCNLYVEDLAPGFVRTLTATASVCTDGNQPIALKRILALRFDGGTEFSFAKETERAGGATAGVEEKARALMKETLVIKSKTPNPAIVLDDNSNMPKIPNSTAPTRHANGAMTPAQIAADVGAERIVACLLESTLATVTLSHLVIQNS